ncbi:MAG: permease [Peptococcaceae bacterium]|nr:permease [Peptococcaceae bacterium]
MIDFFTSLTENTLFIVFIIAALGYLIGGAKIKGIELGSAGVLLVALVFGHFGCTVPSIVNNLGLSLFVTSVGFIAGPGFFRNFRKNAGSYILLGIVIILTGVVTCVAVIQLFGIPADLSSGLLTGALTSTPGLAAAKESAAAAAAAAGLNVQAAEAAVATGYGIAYPFGVVGVVLFVQLVPKLLNTNMEAERRSFEAASGSENKTFAGKLISMDPIGMMAFAFAIMFGVILGRITVPLPGGASFSLGVSGGPLISGLIFGHFGHCGSISLAVRKDALTVFREFGLCLFLIGAGTGGGAGFVAILKEYGAALFFYGAFITVLPMIIGYIIARYGMKLSLFNNLGSICGGMTSTPALGALIGVTGTDNVASAYAATYPIALVSVVLCSQFINILF